MATRRLSLADIKHETHSPEHTEPKVTDWNKCFICQQDNNDRLIYPNRSLRNEGDGFKTIVENLMLFIELDILPFSVERLDEGDGIEKTLKQNNACIHNLCKLEYSKARFQRAAKRKSIATGVGQKSPKLIRTSKPAISNQRQCFFCEQDESVGPLHEASTIGKDSVDDHVRQCAVELGDKRILAKLSAGDLVAQEAKYHGKCLTAFYNRTRPGKSDQKSANVEHGIALAEIVCYINESRSDDQVAKVFKLRDLIHLYENKVKQLGLSESSKVHSTRLKDRIMTQIPDLHSYKEGRDIYLIFKQDVGTAVKKSIEDDMDDEGIHLVKAAKIVRKHMLDMSYKFEGTFDQGCQEAAVPCSLIALVSMILDGTNISDDLEVTTPQSSVSIAQLVQFNSHHRRRKLTEASRHAQRHVLSKETPLPIYLGLEVHAQTRKRKLIDTLYQLGLSISYDRVLAISTELGNNVTQQYRTENVVCPLKLRKELFTVAAVDNLDHNPSSTTAKDSFHGTGISLFQKPTPEKPGLDRGLTLHGENTTGKSIAPLPESYTTINPVTNIKKDPPIPSCSQLIMPGPEVLPVVMQVQQRWLAHVEEKVLQAETEVEAEVETMDISWAAYHASRQPEPEFIPSISSLLPLFTEDSKSVAMIRHSLDVIKKAVEHVNPGQTPVITFDQPLFAVSKQIQWCWPDRYGEDQFIIVLGGLHIEMALWRCLGHWLEGSGWTSALTQAEIASVGVADSFLKASHVTKTRHAHQLTACCLHIALHKAYRQYHGGVPRQDTLAFDDWITHMTEESPQFQYWLLTLQLELNVLMFVKSIREGDFQLYVESLCKLVPWLFALDQTHYARWLPVHIRDMASLFKTHPDIYIQFVNGNFVIRKTQRRFSAISIDQAHEQNNALVKDEGGAIGLTENPAAFLRWMISGPEIARVVTEFEEHGLASLKQPENKHHEQTREAQVSFKKDVAALVNVFVDMGNPFLEESNDLLTLDSKNIAAASVVETVRTVERVGQDQYQTFISERLNTRNKSVFDPIKRNQLHLFNNQTPREASKSKMQIATLKDECSLFSKLYIACQVRESNLDAFFQHENGPYPPALSDNKELRHGTKSDLIGCLLSQCPQQDVVDAPVTQALVIDGAAVVNMLKPGAAKKFSEYAEQVFYPFIENKFQTVERIDLVFDQYLPNSLKSMTRQKRGQGVRRRVSGDNKLPVNWQAFLRIDENKIELFHFLAEFIQSQPIQEGKKMYVTDGPDVLTNPAHLNTDHLAPCQQEEADSRIFLHVADAVNNGIQKLTIRTVDTDVVVLAVSCLQILPIQELWISFGTGRSFKYIAAHSIASNLGVEKSKALPGFHSFTGCDTVSAFNGKGKKSAWETWKIYDEATQAFQVLSSATGMIDATVCATLERFVILLYDRTSGDIHIDQCRKNLFSSKGRSLDAIPPTKGALEQHIKRAAYQAGQIWGQSIIRAPETVSPSDWGWKKSADNKWIPLWTCLSEISESCQELLKCGCKKGCKGNCSCHKKGLKCTGLCYCRGACRQD